jgi:hypothetical protein
MKRAGQIVYNSARASGSSMDGTLVEKPFYLMDEKTFSLSLLLIARLERISADSFWAHRASGVKGSLLKMLEKSQQGFPARQVEWKRMMDLGFLILEKAAKEKNTPGI